MIGNTVQKYRIVQELGSGAMGAVYEAVDTLTERPVAMKILRAELATQPELMERFRGEAVTLGRLNHPNIALLYDFFLDKGNYYMAMEFVRGQPLESIIRHDGCLEATMAWRIMGQTLEAIAHAHSMGVLHRDVKPANILVTGDGRVKVTDFGIARVLGSSRMTRHGRIIGTLEYIAPERIRGDESDPRSDLYSAGVVLYEMLTGKLPFAAQTDFELISAHLEQEPPVLRQVLGTASPGDWNAVVHRAMAKFAEQRFQTAEEFCHALPLVAMAAQVRSSSPAILFRPAQVAEALHPAPESELPEETQPMEDSMPWESTSVSAAVTTARKRPPLALILSAAGALAAAIVLALVLHFRPGEDTRKDSTDSVSIKHGALEHQTSQENTQPGSSSPNHPSQTGPSGGTWRDTPPYKPSGNRGLRGNTGSDPATTNHPGQAKGRGSGGSAGGANQSNDPCMGPRLSACQKARCAALAGKQDAVATKSCKDSQAALEHHN